MLRFWSLDTLLPECFVHYKYKKQCVNLKWVVQGFYMVGRFIYLNQLGASFPNSTLPTIPGSTRRLDGRAALICPQVTVTPLPPPPPIHTTTHTQKRSFSSVGCHPYLLLLLLPGVLGDSYSWWRSVLIHYCTPLPFSHMGWPFTLQRRTQKSCASKTDKHWLSDYLCHIDASLECKQMLPLPLNCPRYWCVFRWDSETGIGRVCWAGTGKLWLFSILSIVKICWTGLFKF